MRAAYRLPWQMSVFGTLVTRSRPDADAPRAPWLSSHAGRDSIEGIVIRCFGAAWLVLVLVGTITTTPHPGWHRHGAGVLAALLVMVIAAVASRPRDATLAVSQRVAALLGVTAATAALAALQPNGPWQNGALIVGIIAALRLERREGMLMLAFSVATLAVVSAAANNGSADLTLLFNTVPWFLVMRLMREIAEQRNALDTSRAAEAQAAAAAERGRLAREMHDVLAHSLSALALQLESTRLLASNHGVEPDVTHAIDQAHQLAAGGLQEARRAIAAARGDELPGPERIGVLADNFEQQSGLPVALEVHGKPREVPPDAQIALYRTAQEALTNVRRHATADRVEVALSYLPRSTVLVIEDRAPAGTPPPPPLELAGPGAGYGLTGMRERAELLGGELLAAPTGSGFRVELRLPT
jgi:signal transduction histidine kinase